MNAGRYIADGVTALTVVNNSNYFGYNTKASANSVTNETVIGYNATGSGSNTVTIGGSAVTGTVIPYGNLGVGVTPSGTYKLEVSGSISGTQLTSTIAIGTAPFTVTSTTPVTNLSIGGNAGTVTTVTQTNIAGAVTPSTSGNVLTSNGTAWVSSAPSGMVYPGAGIAVSTGSAWTTSKASPTGVVVGDTDTQTLTNKRITPRAVTTTSTATPTINTDVTDIYGLTAQAVAVTSFTTNLTGTPVDGQKLWIYIVGTAARAITWGAKFESSTAILPTTTVTTARLDVGFVWNAVALVWRCVAVA